MGKAHQKQKSMVQIFLLGKNTICEETQKISTQNDKNKIDGQYHKKKSIFLNKNKYENIIFDINLNSFELIKTIQATAEGKLTLTIEISSSSGRACLSI
jgi:hypothetical protein